MVKFYRHKQVARITLFGHDDIYYLTQNQYIRHNYEADFIQMKLIRNKWDSK